MRIQTLSILICDLQGYTERQARSTREDIARDLAAFTALLRPVLLAFRGEVVKSMGDAFLACFESPTDAVLAAVQVQKQLARHNQDLPDPLRALRVRIGIATGEISRDAQGDVFGDPVNLAARLQSSAEPGAIWLSESTFLAMNKNEVQAFEVGRRVFKGIPGEVTVYRVLDDFIASARLLTQKELEAALAPIAADARWTRRSVAWVGVLLLAGLALGTWALLRGNDKRTALERYLADPTDLASADAHAATLTRQIYEADAAGTLDGLYREGRIREWFAENRPRLGNRPAFVKLQLVYFMANEPLGGTVAEAVLQQARARPELANDAQFMALLRSTCDYAAKEPALQKVYAEALQVLTRH